MEIANTSCYFLQCQDAKDLPGFISSVHSSTKRLIPGIGGADLHGFTRKVCYIALLYWNNACAHGYVDIVSVQLVCGGVVKLRKYRGVVELRIYRGVVELRIYRGVV